MNRRNITGIVLAGGKSSRMGTDKSLMMLKGKPMVMYAVIALSSICNKVVISSNKNEYDFTGCEVWPDELPQQAPMVGIYSCLKRSTTDTNIFLSCDIPLITTDLLKYLLAQSVNHPITVPVHQNNLIEPLCGIYRKSALPLFEHFLALKNFRLMNLLDTARCNCIKLDDQYKGLFQNINTKEDFEKLK